MRNLFLHPVLNLQDGPCNWTLKPIQGDGIDSQSPIPNPKPKPKRKRNETHPFSFALGVSVMRPAHGLAGVYEAG
jgi:hypothetical protein